MNSEKSKKIIYWALTGIVTIAFLGSAAGKLSGNVEVIKMGAGFGLNAKTYTMIGMVEIIALLLFIIPRTGILGTLLLVAYMGGAIASHLEHGLSIVAPCIVQSFLFITAFYRFPELGTKFLNLKS